MPKSVFVIIVFIIAIVWVIWLKSNKEEVISQPLPTHAEALNQ